MRALGGLALLLLAAEAMRLPRIGRDYAANVAALQGVPVQPRASATLASDQGRLQPSEAPNALSLSKGSIRTEPFDRLRVSGFADDGLSMPQNRHHGTGSDRVSHVSVAGPDHGLHRDDRVAAGAEPGRGPAAAQTAPGETRNAPFAIAPAGSTAFDLATLAYAHLAHGDRRRAVRAFDAALRSGPDDRRAVDWQRARTQLLRRWSGAAWWLLRDGGGSTLAAAPVLGGGQAGASLAYTLDPLARRPLAVVARAAIAADASLGGIVPNRFDGGSTQAALGLRWQLRPGVSVSAERLIAAGANARNDWTVRVAAGGERRFGPARLTGYGEAGVLASGDVYAGGQAALGIKVATAGPATLTTGIGSWASIQHTAATTGRVDVGPCVSVHLTKGRIGFDLSADYRFRVAGRAAPASGPAVTLSAAF